MAAETVDNARRKGPSRPLLRFLGSKWRLAPWIVSHMPKHSLYCEPYGGGAAVLMRKPRVGREVYNDLDGELTNLFSVVRDRGAELVRALRWTPFARAEYYRSLEPSEAPLERARRLIVRSHMGYGSDGSTVGWRAGFRTSSSAGNHIPAKHWAALPRHIVEIRRRFAGVTIENRDARAVLLAYDREHALFYVDPPYVWSTRGSGGRPHHPYRFEMRDDDHRALAGLLRGLKAMVVISGYDCELYRELYAGLAQMLLWQRTK